MKFGGSISRDWLYDSGSISMKLEGCIMGYNTADSEDAGCPENESEDGTIYWYQMANCLRPQAVFSLYSSKSCSSSSFKESVSRPLLMPRNSTVDKSIIVFCTLKM